MKTANALYWTRPCQGPTTLPHTHLARFRRSEVHQEDSEPEALGGPGGPGEFPPESRSGMCLVYAEKTAHRLI